ncbi:hypothetical protein F6P56_06990 [Streptococcus suis]|uniref:hypothetical protein n=1 Tax=Streptococcus suis TaxID=1307 RepID=UPI001EE8E623|nr:hypothetical protein [Streptococcus suis]MBS8038126.1 hypothetical protein [Streptococcus suis]MBS8050263.1 hypothetical protein [Streptococcus suis]
METMFSPPVVMLNTNLFSKESIEFITAIISLSLVIYVNLNEKKNNKTNNKSHTATKQNIKRRAVFQLEHKNTKVSAGYNSTISNGNSGYKQRKKQKKNIQNKSRTTPLLESNKYGRNKKTASQNKRRKTNVSRKRRRKTPRKKR